MERRARSREPQVDKYYEPTVRYERLANFLLAIILRLEGAQSQRTRQHKRLDREQPSQSSSTSPTESVSLYPEYEWYRSTTRKEIYEESETHPKSVRSSLGQSKPEHCLWHGSTTDKTQQDLCSKSYPFSDIGSPVREFKLESIAPTVDPNRENVEDTRPPCPCTIFYTHDADLNPSYRRLDNGAGKLVSTPPKDLTGPEFFFTPKGASSKLHSEDAVDEFDGVDDYGLPNWKHLKNAFLSEASGLYREALLQAEGSRLADGTIYNAIGKLVALSVVESAKKILRECKLKDAVTPQKQRVTFDIPVVTECKFEREFVRKSTPYRPAHPAARENVDLPVDLVPMEIDYYDPIPEVSQQKRDKHVPDVSAATSNKPNPGSIYQESPPVPFKLRTSKPVSNRLLKKVVQMHLSDEECMEGDDSDIEDNITATGDAKTETLKTYSSTTTQTDATLNKQVKKGSTSKRQSCAGTDNMTSTVNKSIQTVSPPLGVINRHALSKVIGCPAPSEETRKRITLESPRKINNPFSVRPGSPAAIPKLKTVIPQSSPLLCSAVKKYGDVTDDTKERVVRESIGIMAAGDFQRQLESYIIRIIEQAINIVSEEKSPNLSSGTLGVCFNRNTPNVTNKANETLTIVTPTSTDKVFFRWSSPAFERAAASLVQTTQQEKFKWTPYKEKEVIGPSRLVNESRVDSTRASAIIRKGERLVCEDIYVSAESGESDDEFVDARSRDSEEEASGLVNDTLIEAVAMRLTKYIIQKSLQKADAEGISSMLEGRRMGKRDTIVVNDHAYAKEDLDNKRDSAITIETESDSQVESGFSDARSSVSDLHVTSTEEQEDAEIVSEVVGDILRSAVAMVNDSLDIDSEVQHADKYATPEYLTDGESGISASSSYHSVASDVTDITLISTDKENAPSIPDQDIIAKIDRPAEKQWTTISLDGSHHQEMAAIFTLSSNDEGRSNVLANYDKLSAVTGREVKHADEDRDLIKRCPFDENMVLHPDRILKPEEENYLMSNNPDQGHVSATDINAYASDEIANKHENKNVTDVGSPSSTIISPSMKTIAELRKELLGVKDILSEYDHSDHSDNIVTRAASAVPIHDSRVSTRSRLPSMAESIEQQQKQQPQQQKQQYQQQSMIPLELATEMEPDAIPGKLAMQPPPIEFDNNLGANKLAAQIFESPEQSPIISPVASASSSSADSPGRSSTKRERSTSAGAGMRKRPRVKTRIFFWEKIGKRKKTKKTRAKVVKPATPAKETVKKFENIIAGTVSLPFQDTQKQAAVSSKPESGFWRNKAFFSALENADAEAVKSEVSAESANDKLRDPAPIDISHSSGSDDSNEYIVPANDQIAIPCHEVKEGKMGKLIMDQRNVENNIDDQGGEENALVDETERASSGDESPRLETSEDILKTAHEDITNDAALEALVRPSKSEEEIQAYMEKCKKIKERTASLLRKCKEEQRLQNEPPIEDANTDANDVLRTISCPSFNGSHDTGDGIFPFGVQMCGSPPDLFNPDQHLAALEEQSDYAASSDDMITVMKESGDTLRKINTNEIRDTEEDTRRPSRQESFGHVSSIQENLAINRPSSTISDQEPFYSAIDVVIKDSTAVTNGCPSSELSRDEPFYSTIDERMDKKRTEDMEEVLPIKKKKKKFRLFKMFRSKKTKKTNLPVECQSVDPESSTSTYVASPNASDDTLRVYSTGVTGLGSSWSIDVNSPPSEGETAAARQNDSWDVSGASPQTSCVSNESSTTGYSSCGGHLNTATGHNHNGHRSLKKRLFHFGKLKQCHKPKHFRQTGRT